ncbi:MAG: hypothetical protein M9939_05260 [Mesorhizobium sp.]|nr:hypothetical protein [Mesorhizobium sp.]
MEDWTYTYNNLDWLLSATNAGNAALSETYTYSTTGNLLAAGGHAGDDNFRPCLAFDPTDPDEAERVDVCVQRPDVRDASPAGAVTGEHGIGYRNRPPLTMDKVPGDA